MAGPTSIPWTDFTWNYQRGCSRLGPDCANCFAIPQARRGDTGPKAGPDGKIRPAGAYWGLTRTALRDGRLAVDWSGRVDRAPREVRLWPLRARGGPTDRAPRCLVATMSDPFHLAATPEWILEAETVMALRPDWVFQRLTKRATRAAAWRDSLQDRRREAVELGRELLLEAFPRIARAELDRRLDALAATYRAGLRHVWEGVSCGDTDTARDRVPVLARSRAPVMFVSYEPAIGRLAGFRDFVEGRPHGQLILGGESGPKARECRGEWIEEAVADAQAAGWAVFVKQIGANFRWKGRRWLTVDPKGEDPEEWPAELPRLRDFPAGGRAGA